MGEIARIAGCSRQTLHTYALLGLIREVERTPGGHREVEGHELARFLSDQPAAVSDGIVRSARNRFTGLVVRVERDGLTAIVEIQAGSHRIVSLMTRDAADELALEVGDVATASVKATNIVVEIPLEV